MMEWIKYRSFYLSAVVTNIVISVAEIAGAQRLADRMQAWLQRRYNRFYVFPGGRPLQWQSGKRSGTMADWIACADLMPDLDEDILLLVGWGRGRVLINVGQRVEFRGLPGWVVNDGADLLDADAVTHWMPLPAVPVQESL